MIMIFGLEAWVLWLVVGVVFIVAEIFTAGFVMMPLGIAALGSSLIAYLLPDAGLAVQLSAFIVVGTILIIFGQKLADKIAKDPEVRVGADRFLQKEAVVIETIDPDKNTGRVRVKQDEWRAASFDDSVINKGTKVTVVEVDGTHLIVKPN